MKPTPLQTTIRSNLDLSYMLQISHRQILDLN